MTNWCSLNPDNLDYPINVSFHVQSTKRILVPGVLDRHHQDIEDRLVVDSGCTIIKMNVKQHCDTSVLLHTFF